jgi:hypothetical protein
MKIFPFIRIGIGRYFGTTKATFDIFPDSVFDRKPQSNSHCTQHNLFNALPWCLANRSKRGSSAEEWRSSSSSTGHTSSAALLRWPSLHSSRIRSSLRCRRAPAKCCGCVTTWAYGLSSLMALLMRSFAASATQCHRASRGGQASTSLPGLSFERQNVDRSQYKCGCTSRCV